MSGYLLPFTGEEVEKVIDGRFHSPIADCVGNDYTVGSPLAMSADTEYSFICNCAVREFEVLPDHITSIWNKTTNIATFQDFLNTPVIVFTIRFKFGPTVAAAGIVTINPYVNETVPIKFKPVSVPYKASLTDVSALVTIYTGIETGFDVKNKGVFFKFESTGAGNMYDPQIEIYRT